MGIAESPLRDRVIFVQGAPRSGTTWLQLLLATHPQIAGVEAESHVFEFGVNNLFDNFEQRRRHLRGMRAYLEREELVDLVRDFCDGMFMAMRSHVSVGSTADFVVEKTPTSFEQASLDLRRKRECFPDGWYLHVVRDGEAVTRSLMRAPWVKDRSEVACRRWWQECVDVTRECLSDLPRYREVSYEDMRRDPATVATDVFRWLDVDVSDEIAETVRVMSRENFSEQFVAPGDGDGSVARRTATATRAAVRRVRDRIGTPDPPPPSPDAAVGFKFVRALREGDHDAIRSLTTENVSLVYCSAAGDIAVHGDDARNAVLEISSRTFNRHHIREWWASSPGGPRDWWAISPGKPFASVFFRAMDGDASRVDLAFALTLGDGRIEELVVVSAGPLAGRPARALDIPKR